MATITHTTNLPVPHRPDPARTLAAIDKRSYLTLATVSGRGRPHAAGVLYERSDAALYVNTIATSRKARNIAGNQAVGVVIPVRRLPVGAPPSAIQFQSTARILAADSAEIRRLVADGGLSSITGHGELDLPGSCFLKISLPRRVLTYGLGMSLLALAKDPLGAGGATELER